MRATRDRGACVSVLGTTGGRGRAVRGWEGEGRVLICKVREEGRSAVQTIPVKAFEVGRFQVMFRRERWKHCFEAQSLDT